jgi:hypothetical protein
MKSTQHVVVDKKTGECWPYDTRQEAWTAWQEKWIGKGLGMMDRYALGQYRNMKEYTIEAQRRCGDDNDDDRRKVRGQ